MARHRLAVAPRPRLSTLADDLGEVEVVEYSTAEFVVRAALDGIRDPRFRVLHGTVRNRRDSAIHLAVTPGAVWVIRAIGCPGERPQRGSAGILRRSERLLLGERNATGLVDGVRADVVRMEGWCGVPGTGMLCCVDSDWPMFGGPFTVHGVEVTTPKRLVGRIRTEADGSNRVDRIAAQLAEAVRRG